MQERREAERLRIELKVCWEALRTQGRGAVCDLSSLGCFVLTGADVKPGDLIRNEIKFPREAVWVWGHVVYAVAEIGFALRFAFIDEAERQSLSQLIKTVNQS
jgi:PilZ domain